VEEAKRREIEIQGRLASLQANRQYLVGRTSTLGMDIDQQDKQEEALNRQINEFNKLIREKEAYMKQLLNEVRGLKEEKDQFEGEVTMIAGKEEYLVGELIYKEDQLNEVKL